MSKSGLLRLAVVLVAAILGSSGCGGGLFDHPLLGFPDDFEGTWDVAWEQGGWDRITTRRAGSQIEIRIFTANDDAPRVWRGTYSGSVLTTATFQAEGQFPGEWSEWAGTQVDLNRLEGTFRVHVPDKAGRVTANNRFVATRD